MAEQADWFWPVAGLVAGGGLGIGLGWVLATLRARAELAGLLARGEQQAGLLATLEGERDKLTGEAISLREAKSQLEARNATLEEKLRGEQARLIEHQQRFEADRKTMTDTFEALAGKALKGSTDELLKIAEQRFRQLQESSGGDLDKRQQAIAQLVKPVHDNLSQMREQLSQLEKEREGACQSLRQ